MTLPTILRIYDPVECDANGVPLDYERCRACCGVGMVFERTCDVCDGHGSLKAAALAYLTTTCGAREESVGAVCNRRPHDDRWHGEIRDGETWAGWGGGEPNPQRQEPARCDGCGHPMNEGTWEHGHLWQHAFDGPLRWLRGEFSDDAEPPGPSVHWSPCDEGCRHGGPMRVGDPPSPYDPYADTLTAGRAVAAWPRRRAEASWRPVDVRPLGWPHDLRPERLAVLCLRCLAERDEATL